jgi:hypothetical protein
MLTERLRGDLRAADRLADGVEIVVNTSPPMPAQLALLYRLLRSYRRRRYRSQQTKEDV